MNVTTEQVGRSQCLPSLKMVVVYFPALKLLKIRSLEELLRILQDFLTIFEEFFNDFQSREIDNYTKNVFPVLLFHSLMLLFYQKS